MLKIIYVYLFHLLICGASTPLVYLTALLFTSILLTFISSCLFPLLGSFYVYLSFLVVRSASIILLWVPAYVRACIFVYLSTFLYATQRLRCAVISTNWLRICETGFDTKLGSRRTVHSSVPSSLSGWPINGYLGKPGKMWKPGCHSCSVCVPG